MLPGLREFLESVPADKRHGWIANPYPIKRIVPRDATWIRPCAEDLEALAKAYTNRAIGRAFGVSDTTVRGWLDQECISRKAQFYRGTPEIPDELADEVRGRGSIVRRRSPGASIPRLTKDRVSRVISKIGETAGIIVVLEDERSGKRRKYASAHDIRRGFARRLINAGVSAETLKVVMRHSNFATTEKHYGAIRSAQVAAIEVHEKLATNGQTKSFVGGFVGGKEKAQPLVRAELDLLKSLIERL